MTGKRVFKTKRNGGKERETKAQEDVFVYRFISLMITTVHTNVMVTYNSN